MRHYRVVFFNEVPITKDNVCLFHVLGVLNHFFDLIGTKSVSRL